MRRHDSSGIRVIKALLYLLLIIGLFHYDSTQLKAQSSGAPEFATGVVLVKFSPGVSMDAKSKARNSIQGQFERGYKIVPGLEKLATTLPVEKAISILEKNPNVEYAEPDYKIELGQTIPNDPNFGVLWGIHNTGQSGGTADADIDAPEAWDIFTGDPNTLVAIIDTGVDINHEDLVDNIWTNPGETGPDGFGGNKENNGIDDDGNGFVDDVHGWDFRNEDNDPADGHGHGTHVSGTVCGKGNNNKGVAGVVWSCKLVPLKFLSDGGSGWTSDAVEAVQYSTDMGVNLSNNSWGGGGFSQSLFDAIKAARDQIGHIFCAAAGNDGRDTDLAPHYPSSYNLDSIISVAAIDRNDNMASFSNWGATSVDLGAPGVSIRSSLPGNTYASWSGTSMATPHVCGVVALVFGLHPEWSYDQIINRIFSTVRPVASMSGNTVTGGVVNAYDAINGIADPPVSPDPPSNLNASAASDSAVDLNWVAGSGASEYVIERSETGPLTVAANWHEIDVIPASQTSYTDTALNSSSEYCYRVKSRNSEGDSDYADPPACATTDDPPPYIDKVATSQQLVSGSIISGFLSDTYDDDGAYEVIREQQTGGKPSKRRTFMEKKWTFNISGGSVITFYVNAFQGNDGSGDGDSFIFQYWDGSQWVNMVTITPSDNYDDTLNPYYTYSLPNSMTGNVEIRAVDSIPSTQGNNVRDELVIDHIFIRCDNAGDPPIPPPPPTNLVAEALSSSEIKLQWDEVLDATGYNIERSPDGSTWSPIDTVITGSNSVGVEAVEYTDQGLDADTKYYYRANSFNSGGTSDGYSNIANATTNPDDPSNIVLATSPYFRKNGKQSVDLDWTGAVSSQVDIYRDGNKIATTVNDGSYTNNINNRGGGVCYTYQVCEAGSGTDCSNTSDACFN